MSLGDENKNKLNDFFQAIKNGDKNQINSLRVYFNTLNIDPFFCNDLSKNVFDFRQNNIIDSLIGFILNTSFSKDKKVEQDCIEYILFLQDKGFDILAAPDFLHPEIKFNNDKVYPYLSILLQTKENKSVYNKALKLILTTLKIEEKTIKNDNIFFNTIHSALNTYYYNHVHTHSALPRIFNKLMAKGVFQDNFFSFKLPIHYSFENKIKAIDYSSIYRHQIKNDSLQERGVTFLPHILFNKINNLSEDTAQQWFDFYKRSQLPFSLINDSIIEHLLSFNNQYGQIENFKTLLMNINKFNKLLEQENLYIDASFIKRKENDDKRYLEILDLFYLVIKKDNAYSSKDNTQFLLNIFNKLNINFNKKDVFYAVFDDEIHSQEEEYFYKKNHTYYSYEQFVFLRQNISNFSKIKIYEDDLGLISEFYCKTYGEYNKMHRSLFDNSGLAKEGYNEESYKKINYLFSHLDEKEKIQGILNINDEYIYDFNFFLIKILLDDRFIQNDDLNKIVFKNNLKEEKPLIEAFNDYIKLNILNHNPQYFKNVYPNNYKEKIIEIFKANNYSTEMEFFFNNTMECLKNINLNPLEKNNNGETLFHSIVLFLHSNFNRQSPEELKDILEELITTWKKNIPEEFKDFHFPKITSSILPELKLIYEKYQINYFLKINKNDDISFKRKRI